VIPDRASSGHGWHLVRKVVFGVISFAVAWLGVSVVLGLAFGFLVNPLPWLVYQMTGPLTSEMYSTLTGLEVFVATVLVGLPLYRGLVRKWGGLSSSLIDPVAGHTARSDQAERSSTTHEPADERQDLGAPIAASRPPTVTAKGVSGWRGHLRPTPLLLAVGAAVVWAILSIGPEQLVSDLDGLIPSDTVTAPSCYGAAPVNGHCVDAGFAPLDPYAPFLQPVTTFSSPGCFLSGELEADGRCHLRSVGTGEQLLNDVISGAESGLFAFLAVGAALLLWPRLRAASVPPVATSPEPK
jgi:hypothetical protein